MKNTKAKNKQINKNPNGNARILIIYTGGTIGMVQDHDSGVLKPIDFSQIRKETPEIKKFGYHIEVESFHPVLDSSDMQPEHWVKMATLISDNYNRFDGFVILHGTDTLAYTASALSFMLENLSKPVIITGAQLPVGEIRTDARENLITSIEIAASKINGKPAVPEVCVYFDYLLFRGNRVTKMNAAKFEAFQSVNFPPLCEAGVHLRFNNHLIATPSGKNLKVHTKLNNRVGVIRMFPGMTREWFRALLRVPGNRAIVLETYGSGNAPSEGWFIEELRKACEDGMLVVNITQCPGGAVEQGRYATSSKLAKMGVVGGADLTLEAALTKLYFLLANYKSTSEIKRLIASPIRGELTIFAGH